MVIFLHLHIQEAYLSVRVVKTWEHREHAPVTLDLVAHAALCSRVQAATLPTLKT